jgi:hypothetical protein
MLAYEHAKEVNRTLGRERLGRQPHGLGAQILVMSNGTPPLYQWLLEDAYLQEWASRIRAMQT